VAGPDRQRPELVERETAIREPGGDLFDAVQLGLEVRVGGLLPGSGVLERDPVGVQDLPQPFPTHGDWVGRDGGGAPVAAAQVGRQLAQAPMRERHPQLLRPGQGGGDDDRDVGISDQAGPASGPVRVQRGQPGGVERVNHSPDRVVARGDKMRDRRCRRPGRGRHDDDCSADLDRASLAPPHDPQQALALGVSESTSPYRSGHG
jgi:hypothetical protein